MGESNVKHKTAVLISAGESFEEDDLFLLRERGDTVILNYAYIHIARRFPKYRPAYHASFDCPKKFSTVYHSDPTTKSLVHQQFKERDSRWIKNAEWIDIPVTEDMELLKGDPFRHQFYYRKPTESFKTILATVHYLVRQGYNRLEFYACDFIANQNEWYHGISKEPLTKEKYQNKRFSLDQMLDRLERWHPFALSRGCEWYSLSEISKMNKFVPYCLMR